MGVTPRVHHFNVQCLRLTRLDFSRAISCLVSVPRVAPPLGEVSFCLPQTSMTATDSIK